MDHISKALERAQADRGSVRDWVKPRAPATSRRAAPLEAAGCVLDYDHMASRHLLTGDHREDPLVADKYRVLRTRVLQLMKPRGWSRVGITSASAQAGKTLTAINLALTLARDGNHDVFLVDADLRKPSIAADLGLPSGHGLIDYLSEEADLDGMLLQPHDLPCLRVLVGGGEASATATPELLGSPRMDYLMTAFAKGPQSLVIVDLPPLFVGDDVLAVAPRLDAMLLIVDEGTTSTDELEEAASLLSDYNLLGTVLNRSTEKASNYGSYYQLGTRN